MAGTKNAPKALPKLVASSTDGQQSLLHFYKKKSKPSKDSAKVMDVTTVEPEVVSPGPGDASSDHPALPPTEGMQTSVSLSTETALKERIGNVSNIPPDSRALRTTYPGQSELIEVVPENSTTREISPQRLLSELELESLQQPSIIESANSPSGADTSSAPLPKEPYPIFKRHLPRPSSHQSSAGVGKRPPNQRASSKSSPLERRRKPEANTCATHTGVHDVIDLTESLHHDEPTKCDTSLRNPIIVIDDEREIRGSQDAPIEITASPPSKIQQPKITHPFFARRTTNRKEVDDVGTSRMTTFPHMQTPWPDAEMQHNRGPQSRFLSSAPSPFPAYRRVPPPAWFSSQPDMRLLEHQLGTQPFFAESRRCALKSHVPTPLEREEIVSKMPYSHREHSGISRLLDVDPASPGAAENGELWTHKWRPRSAAEVLGNEDNLRYMKEWLEALEIRTRQTLVDKPDTKKGMSTTVFGSRGAKRPIVVRAVEKTHGRKKRRVDCDESSLENWLVHEEEEEEEATFANGGPEDDSFRDRFSPVNGVSVLPSNTQSADEAGTDNARGRGHAQFAHLTNTILLTGPSGSGKTSAVYACAEELGWEVFEVYPGIGRRSGANISSLVGDVGKNHLVGRASRSSGKGASVQSFIRSGFGFMTEEDHGNDAVSEDGIPIIRQSVILLEEVDILFKEDASFWPAVINIIKYSHRPVFMTCNDLSLVPRDDLPLQATLLFRPCSPGLATSFLESVCLAEGQVVSRQQLEALYTTTYELIGPDQPDEPQVPYPSQPPACSDLRRVLNELQFWCQREVSKGDDGALTETSFTNASGALADWSSSAESLSGEIPEEDPSQGRDIVLMWEHSEYASYVDGYLERRPSHILEALAIDRHGPSVDDEIGHTLLEKHSVMDCVNSLAFYSRDEEIAGQVLGESRHVFGTSGAGPRGRRWLGNKHRATLECRSLRRDRATNQVQVASYLDDVIALCAPLLPRPAAVLEYAAYVRQMVRADDAGSGGSAVRGRETRSRWRLGECRYLTLSAKGLEGARTTRLGGDG